MVLNKGNRRVRYNKDRVRSQAMRKARDNKGTDESYYGDHDVERRERPDAEGYSIPEETRVIKARTVQVAFHRDQKKLATRNSRGFYTVAVPGLRKQRDETWDAFKKRVKAEPVVERRKDRHTLTMDLREILSEYLHFKVFVSHVGKLNQRRRFAYVRRAGGNLDWDQAIIVPDAGPGPAVIFSHRYVQMWDKDGKSYSQDFLNENWGTLFAVELASATPFRLADTDVLGVGRDGQEPKSWLPAGFELSLGDIPTSDTPYEPQSFSGAMGVLSEVMSEHHAFVIEVMSELYAYTCVGADFRKEYVVARSIGFVSSGRASGLADAVAALLKDAGVAAFLSHLEKSRERLETYGIGSEESKAGSDVSEESEGAGAATPQAFSLERIIEGLSTLGEIELPTAARAILVLVASASAFVATEFPSDVLGIIRMIVPVPRISHIGDLLDFIREHTKTVLECVAEAVETRSFGPFFRVRVQEDPLLARILRVKMAVEADNILNYPNMDFETQEDFYRYAADLNDDILRLMRMPRPPEEVRRYAADVASVLRRVNRKREGSPRPRPYGVMLYGPSQVGKTYLMYLFSKVLMKDRFPDLDLTPEMFWSINMSSQYADGLNCQQRVYLYDDMANAKLKAFGGGDVNYVNLILQSCNSTWTYANKAAVEEKGTIMYAQDLSMGSTNDSSLKAASVSCEPTSVTNRWRFIDVRVIESCAMSGARLDKTKAAAQTDASGVTDAWGFMPYEWLPDPQDPTKIVRHNLLPGRVDIYGILAYLVEDQRKHTAHEAAAAALQVNLNMDAIDGVVGRLVRQARPQVYPPNEVPQRDRLYRAAMSRIIRRRVVRDRAEHDPEAREDDPAAVDAAVWDEIRALIPQGGIENPELVVVEANLREAAVDPDPAPQWADRYNWTFRDLCGLPGPRHVRQVCSWYYDRILELMLRSERGFDGFLRWSVNVNDLFGEILLPFRIIFCTWPVVYVAPVVTLLTTIWFYHWMLILSAGGFYTLWQWAGRVADVMRRARARVDALKRRAAWAAVAVAFAAALVYAYKSRPKGKKKDDTDCVFEAQGAGYRDCDQAPYVCPIEGPPVTTSCADFQKILRRVAYVGYMHAGSTRSYAVVLPMKQGLYASNYHSFKPVLDLNLPVVVTLRRGASAQCSFTLMPADFFRPSEFLDLVFLRISGPTERDLTEYVPQDLLYKVMARGANLDRGLSGAMIARTSVAHKQIWLTDGTVGAEIIAGVGIPFSDTKLRSVPFGKYGMQVMLVVNKAGITLAGDCGSGCFWQTSTGQGVGKATFLSGLFSGHKDGEGLVTPIFQSVLRKAITHFDTTLPQNMEVPMFAATPQKILVERAITTVLVPPSSRLDYVGTEVNASGPMAGANTSSLQTSRSALKVSVLAGAADGILPAHGTKVPVSKGDTDYRRVLTQMAVEVPEIPDPEAFHKAREDYLQAFRNSLQVPGKLDTLKPCTLFEAINGTAEYPGLPMQTAVGPGLSAGKGRSNSKAFFFDMVCPVRGCSDVECVLPHYPEDGSYLDENRVNWWPKPELLDMYYDMIARLDRGERDLARFVGRLKMNEAIPLEKNKCRVFYVGTTALNLLVRQYFTPIYKVSDPFLGECFVGMNAQSREWEQMEEWLEEYHKLERLAGDFRGYDTSQHETVTHEAWNVPVTIAREIEWDGAILFRMEGIAANMARPIYVMLGEVYRASGTLPSGVACTTNVNSSVSSMLWRYTFYVHNPEEVPVVQVVETVRGELPLTTFQRNVRTGTYGDDSLGAKKEGSTALIDNQRMAEACGSIGLEFTSIDKSSDVVPFYHRDQASFLKRRGVYVEQVGFRVGAIELESISKSLQWASNQDYTAYRNTAESALRLYMPHAATIEGGRERYELLRTRLAERLRLYLNTSSEVASTEDEILGTLPSLEVLLMDLAGEVGEAPAPFSMDPEVEAVFSW